jgi:hypothetical protein
MPISLKAAAGGGGSSVNSIAELFTDDLLHTTPEGQKWLRTGWVDTNVGQYPDATKTTIALDMTTSGISYAGSSNIAQVDHYSGAGAVESYFAISADRTRAAIPCGTTSNDLNTLALFTVNGGANWNTLSLTAQVSHNYNMCAIGTTRNMFVGFDVGSPTVVGSKFIKTTSTFTAPETPVDITTPNLRYVAFTGTNFVMMNQSGKVVRVPDATNSITYLTDAPFSGVDVLVSPSAGVLLTAVNNAGSSNIFRSADEGSSWTSVLSLPVTPNQNKIVSLYVDGSKIYAVVAGNIIATSNQFIKIYTSINGGVNWNEVPYTFTWDGITYGSATGWPTSVAPAVYGSANLGLNGLFKDTSTSFRFPLYFNDTKMCYLQSMDNGVSWTMLKPATRTVWNQFVNKAGNEGKFWYTAQLTTGNFALVNAMASPNTDPLFKFQGSTTFVGVPDVYSATGSTGSPSIGTSVAGTKFVRVL